MYCYNCNTSKNDMVNCGNNTIYNKHIDYKKCKCEFYFAKFNDNYGYKFTILDLPYNDSSIYLMIDVYNNHYNVFCEVNSQYIYNELNNIIRFNILNINETFSYTEKFLLLYKYIQKYKNLQSFT